MKPEAAKASSGEERRRGLRMLAWRTNVAEVRALSVLGKADLNPQERDFFTEEQPRDCDYSRARSAYEI
eukprot:519199-Pelagomonas_calceolata.AAC.1